MLDCRPSIQKHKPIFKYANFYWEFIGWGEGGTDMGLTLFRSGPVSIFSPSALYMNIISNHYYYGIIKKVPQVKKIENHCLAVTLGRIIVTSSLQALFVGFIFKN